MKASVSPKLFLTEVKHFTFPSYNAKKIFGPHATVTLKVEHQRCQKAGETNGKNIEEVKRTLWSK